MAGNTQGDRIARLEEKVQTLDKSIATLSEQSKAVGGTANEAAADARTRGRGLPALKRRSRN